MTRRYSAAATAGLIGLVAWFVGLDQAMGGSGWQASPPRHGVTVMHNVMVPMRDGIRLSTDVYLPDAESRFPVVLERDPYGNGSQGEYPKKGRLWASRGYVYLHQDVRGRYDSEGEWYAFVNEAGDGYDSVEWAGKQPWSNGRVALVGGSYSAFAQWQAASLRSPYLKTIVPMFSPLSIYSDMHPGGAFELTRIAWAVRMDGRTGQAFAYDWNRHLPHLPLRTLDAAFGHRIPLWRDWMDHPSYDVYWQRLDLERQLEAVDVPALHIGGWFDTFLRSTLAAYTGMVARAPTEATRRSQRFLVGPWPHTANPGQKTGDLDFGPQAKIDLDRLQLRWLDYWLKGVDDGILSEPPVRIFAMGQNKWRTEDQWPPARMQPVKYYLHSGGRANSLSGDGTLSTTLADREAYDRFVYSPENPVRTKGGSLPGTTPALEPGPFDQRDVEQREDVLVYTSDAVTAELEVTGPLTVTLYASSSAKDTDFTAKLLDVHPDGRTYNLADGIVRARYRESNQTPTFIEPGRVYAYTIDLVATSNVFLKGHRIRLEISSSNFPRFDRNPNTGQPFGQDAQLTTATQIIYHDRARPSQLVLPVVPASN